MRRNSGGGGQLFQVKQELFKAFHTQFENLKAIAGNRIFFSITGGKDSGVSFYSTQDLNHDCFFYTYPFKEDIQNARRMAQEHDLNWFSLQDPEIAEYDKNPYYQFFDKINHRNRFPATTSPSFIGWECLNQFPGQWIHINSGFHEIGRGRDFLTQEASSYSLDTFNYYSRGGHMVKFRPMIPKDDKFILDLSEKYFKKLDLEKVAELGYNPWDFIYWEDQTAGWLSQSYYNFLPFAENANLINCRRVIEIMWQVPDEYINNSYLLYTCILNEYDPRYREESFMDKSTIREVTMGKNFKPSPKDQDNYALVYGGYMLKGDPIEIAKKALEVNPTIEWAIRALQNPNTDKK